MCLAVTCRERRNAKPHKTSAVTSGEALPMTWNSIATGTTQVVYRCLPLEINQAVASFYAASDTEDTVNNPGLAIKNLLGGIL